jgi:flagellar biosynthesis/type III secretory pathway protein FliH
MAQHNSPVNAVRVSDLSLADQLEYDAFYDAQPEHIRNLLDRAIAAQSADAEDEFERGNGAGYEEGKREARIEFEEELDQQKTRLEALEARVNELEDVRTRLEAELEDAREENRHEPGEAAD